MFEPIAVPRLVVSGATARSGKTAVMLGLIGALQRRGRTIQTYKVGPDIVDAAHLSHVSQRPCRTLDSWLLDQSALCRSLGRGTVGADCAIVEGCGGLFDSHGVPAPSPGADEYSFPGSTAEVARVLGAPILVVLDLAGIGETAAAVALGLRQLDPSLNIVGVILNNVETNYRRRLVEDAIWNQVRLPVLGALPRIHAIAVTELRDGVSPVSDRPQVDDAFHQLTTVFERDCSVGLIERLMGNAHPLTDVPSAPTVTCDAADPVRIGVAFDDAFCFYYPENLELLQDAGAEIVPFSPLDDRALPDRIDAVYFGGGLSEAVVPRLATNRSFAESLRRAAGYGIPIYSECAGLHYMARTLTTRDGSTHEMVGIVPIDIAMDGICRSGYRELTIAAESHLGPRGSAIRGHEFHFSHVVSGNESLSPAYSVHDGEGEPLGFEGWCSGSVMASFVHVHFGQNPELASRLVDAARETSRRRRQQAALV